MSLLYCYVLLWNVLIIASVLASNNSDTSNNKLLLSTYSNLVTYYNIEHPIYVNSKNKLLLSSFVSRCILVEPRKAITSFINNKYIDYNNNYNILITTPCLGSDSLGNMLSSYFENIICAYKAGLHFFSINHIWEPKLIHTSNIEFINHLPRIIINNNYNNNSNIIKNTINKICPCSGLCHERVKSLWITNKDIIKPIYMAALNKHIESLDNNITTIINANDISNKPVNTVIPLIPEVAIHYRCSDNFVGHYGFLPFTILSKLIPKNSKTIYIIAENINRKSMSKSSRTTKCNIIFNNLYNYLNNIYYNSIIIIRRGDDIGIDLARLTYANITICSVSTFCLWPAYFNNNQRYFPLTKLIVNGNSQIDLGFKWITSPILLGSKNEHIPIQKLILKLLGQLE